MLNLTSRELADLVGSVFPRFATDRVLAVLVDVPREPGLDNPAWKERRRLAREWHAALVEEKGNLPLERLWLVAYPDVGSNNADLPSQGFLMEGEIPDLAGGLAGCGESVDFETVFSEVQLFLAPTEYSTTAPLKVAARRHGFRAATMPGFSPEMIPALRIDYGEVARRVELLKDRLDRAESADIRFRVDGGKVFEVHFDLRHRAAHSSSGRFPQPGTAGNLPSGEAYIVPYEGEAGEASRTAGRLPVEVDGEVLFFDIQANRAVGIAGDGVAADRERDHLRREPAYGNLAELGFGVLGDFGLDPIGEILLDEKLGLHVAFGRSDHFGGVVGLKDFSSPAAVIHLDRIYIPRTQPRVAVSSVILTYAGGCRETLMSDGGYLLF